MNSILTFQIAVVVLALLFVVAFARIYFAAILPVLRNQRLARRGLGYEPAYRREGRGIFGLALKLVLVVAVFAVLAAILIPAMQDYRSNAKDRQRIADIKHDPARPRRLLSRPRHLSGEHRRHAFDVPASPPRSSRWSPGAIWRAFPTIPTATPMSTSRRRTAAITASGTLMERRRRPSTCDTDHARRYAGQRNYVVGP